MSEDLRLQIVVGSTNPVKVAAATAVRDRDARLVAIARPNAVGVSVPSGVSAQPRNVREMMQGAVARAQGAVGTQAQQRREIGILGIGIESGIFMTEIPVGARKPSLELTFDATAAAILLPNGELLLGMSPAWRLPADLAQMLRYGEMELDEALVACGYTTDPHLGQSIGAIGLLSGGRASRQSYTEIAIEMALFGWKGLVS